MTLLEEMKAAYARVPGYQTETTVTEYREGRIDERRRFLYSFEKPDHVRIDMKSPYPGMVLIYPDPQGKVALKFGGWLGFLHLHLSLGSSFLVARAGQRIDQTDLGLLIRNIGHSLTDQRRSKVTVTEEKDRVELEVLAEDHFLPRVLTRYLFVIDKRNWLPEEIVERTPKGDLKRRVAFRKVRIVPDFPVNFFHLEGEEADHGSDAR